jgi:multidrug efflux system outer membrane protein
MSKRGDLRTAVIREPSRGGRSRERPAGRAVRASVALAASLALLSGCAVVGDNYSRPTLDTPSQYRASPAGGPSLAATSWRDVFTDPTLQKLIERALAGNLDLQSAAARVRESQAQLVVVRAERLPTLGLGLTTTPTALRPSDTFTSTFLAAGLLSWEVDLWGRIARRVEAGEAEVARAQASRDGAQVSLVAEVASRYFEIGGLRDVLEATERNAQLQRDALRLMRRRNEAGIVSAAEVRQAEVQLATTEARVPGLQRDLSATENALALLLGAAPMPAPGERVRLTLPPALPAGLPSELVDRRPDLREAEQRLVAANARVGEARALLLPSLSITGALGRVSTALDGLVRNTGSDVASLGPNVSQTLYAGGALQANRAAAIARLDQALLAYRRTALNALREVSDAITSYDRIGEELQRQDERVKATLAALRLADRRFGAGVTSYLEVLDAQRQLLSAETDRVNATRARQVALVQVYRALGGGWEPAAR